MQTLARSRTIYTNPTTVEAMIRVNGVEAVRRENRVPRQLLDTIAARLDEEREAHEAQFLPHPVPYSRVARLVPDLRELALPFPVRLLKAVAACAETAGALDAAMLRLIARRHGADIAEALDGKDARERLTLAGEVGFPDAAVDDRDDVRAPIASHLIVDRVRRRVCRLFGISRSDLDSDRRTRVIVCARFMAMYWIKRLTPLSYPAIGRRFGGKDHTTVISACRKINGLLEGDDEQTTAAVKALEMKLGA